MKKKLVALLLASCMLSVLLLGCKDPTAEPGADATTAGQTAAEQTDTEPQGDAETNPPAAETTPSAQETEPVTEPVEDETEPPSTETEPPEVEMGSRLELTAYTLSVADGKVILSMNAEVKEDGLKGTVSLTLSDESGVVSENTLTADGGHTVSMDCPSDKINGALTLTAVAADGEGTVLDEITLKLNNGLPQLTPDGVNCVVAAMTADEKAQMVTGVQEPVKPGASGGTFAIERLGVPSITVNDGPAGVRYESSVWYPSVQNLTSSWDPALIATVGESIGEDSLALGIDVVLGPGMNIQKNILGGRNFEYCSEDPILTALMSGSYVRGMQSSGAIACIKHYAANNQESSRGVTSANVTERALREIYLKAFGLVVKDADPLTVMSSYNCLNGLHTSVNRDLLTGILREEFGFTGLVMSDWGAAGTMADKVMAGNDINMPGEATDAADVLAALENGSLTVDALDASCRYILSVVAQSPTFKGLEMDTRVDWKNHNEVAATAAADTMILLQNKNATLPLAKETAVAVFGNGAYRTVLGGYGSGGVSSRVSVDIATGLQKGDLKVVGYSSNPFKNSEYHDALDESKDVPVTEAYAQEMANTADTAVIVISRSSGEDEDRTSIKGDYLLNDTEAEMIDRVSAAFHAKGKKVVVILNSGFPMEVASWREKVDSIISVGYAGQGTGTALAQVLVGDVNPSAKTAITWPMSYDSTPAVEYFPGNAADVTYYEDIYVGYRYYTTFDVDVAYPFGYGLSYTTFDYSEFSVVKNDDGTLTATVKVTNTGSVAGREVVQIYVSKPETLQEQAALELGGFGKTQLLAPGESETVTVTISTEALMTYDTANSRWILDQGTYTIAVGASSADLKARETLSFDTVTVVQDVENRCEPDTVFDYIQKATYSVPSRDPSDRRENLALYKPADSNHSEAATQTPNRAVDGSHMTRWSGLGLPAGDHYWQVDLGQTYAIGEIEILWESVYVPFTLLLSEDGVTFTAYDTYANPEDMRSLINLHGAETRYIRLEIPRGNYVSIYEFFVYEATAEDLT